MVGKYGFCKLHRDQADLAAKKESKDAQSRRGVNDALHWPSGRFHNEIVDTIR